MSIVLRLRNLVLQVHAEIFVGKMIGLDFSSNNLGGGRKWIGIVMS